MSKNILYLPNYRYFTSQKLDNRTIVTNYFDYNVILCSFEQKTNSYEKSHIYITYTIINSYYQLFTNK